MKLLTAKEIAGILKQSPRHVAERVTKRRDFPPEYRIGKVRRWAEEDVQAWIERRRVGA